MKNIRALDGLRCLAVILVLVDHWSEEKIGLPLGPLGVSIFFVLSGFLISSILLRSKSQISIGQERLGHSLKLFYVRRTLRIFPLYYLVVFLGMILKETSLVQYKWWHIFYLSNFKIALKNGWLGVSDHLWSLSVEEQFYIIFPILLLLAPKNKEKYLAYFFIVIALLSRLYFANIDQWIPAYVLMPACLDAFGMGLLLALFKEPLQKIRVPFLWVAFGTYAVALATVGHNHNFINIWFLRSFESLFGMALITTLLSQNVLSKFFEWGPFVHVGRVSYGVYLFHNFVFNHYHTPASHPTARILQHLPPYLPFRMIFLIAITIGIATVSWYLFEKPILKLKSRFEYEN